MESSLTIAIILGRAFKLYMAQYNERIPSELTFIGMVRMPDVGVKIPCIHQLTSVTIVIPM
jgi:hypothetical protein